MHKKMYVGGNLIEGSTNQHHEVLSPVNEAVIGSVAYAHAQDVEKVVDAAKHGFALWKRLSPQERRAWMLKLRDALLAEKEGLIHMLMHETGKQRAVAEDDFDKLQSALVFFPEAMAQLKGAMIADAQNEAEHRISYAPIGPVVAYLAWNFPLLNLGFKLGPILASGCSVIIKPAALTPLTSYRIGEICESISFPRGVINIVLGDDESFGAGLSAHKDIAGITMIGSTPSALKVIKNSATSIKRFSLELGGNAPFLVFEDADVEKALELLMVLKTANTGQICVAPNRILLHESIAELFIKKLVPRLAAVQLGDPLQDEGVMGPLASKKERDRVADYVERALAAGAKKLCGDAHTVPTQGYFYPPTLLTHCTKNNPAFQEEVFGPVVSIGTFKSDDEALEIANDTRAGLASYVFSNNAARLRRVAHALECGEVMINGCKWDIYLPHIGVKDSGLGVDCSSYALYDYLSMKRTTTL